MVVNSPILKLLSSAAAQRGRNNNREGDVVVANCSNIASGSRNDVTMANTVMI